MEVSIENAQYGDVIFFKPIGLLNSLIPLIDGSPFSHVALYLGKFYGHHFIIESNDKVGVQVKRLQNWRNFTIIRPTINPLSPEEILRYEGKSYDFGKLIKILLFKFLKIPLTSDDDEAQICSEFVNIAYNYKLTEKGTATPATLFKSLTN